MQSARTNKTSVLWLLAIILSLVSNALPQCEISVGQGIQAADWNEIFTQSGPGQKLEPKNAAGWTGGDSTYSILLPNGDTAFFFSDSYIAESPIIKGDGTVFTNASGLRTREPNCLPPLCTQPASSHSAYNSIVIRSADGKTLTTTVGAKNASGL